MCVLRLSDPGARDVGYRLHPLYQLQRSACDLAKLGQGNDHDSIWLALAVLLEVRQTQGWYLPPNHPLRSIPCMLQILG